MEVQRLLVCKQLLVADAHLLENVKEALVPPTISGLPSTGSQLVGRQAAALHVVQESRKQPSQPRGLLLRQLPDQRLAGHLLETNPGIFEPCSQLLKQDALPMLPAIGLHQRRAALTVDSPLPLDALRVPSPAGGGRPFRSSAKCSM